MNILKTIFRFEYQQLKRNNLMLGLLLLITACSLYAIYYGCESTNRQLKNIAFLEQKNDSTQQVFQDYFKNKITADTVRFGWAKMNSLYDGFTTEDYLEHNVAINKPNRLTHLSLGQRDIYPIYRRVTARSLYYDGSGISLDDKNSETNNPHKLLAGNFDLSFVFLFLFPLFIISLCYNVVSQEKELGTFPILSTQPVSLLKIICYKFFFRFLIIITLVVIYSLIGYWFSPVAESFPFSLFAIWLVVLLSYMLFWFAISFLVVTLKQDSSISALLLVGFWMLFLIIIPSLINNYIAANYKISSRTKFVTELGKEIAGVWELDDKETLPVYFKVYPQYATNPIKLLWTEKDSYDSLSKNEDIDNRYNKKLLLYHFILDQNIKKQLAIYNQQINRKMEAVEQFSWLNPVALTQEALNEVAASGYKQNQEFKKETAKYRDLIFEKSNRFIFGEKKLTLQDYKSYSKFKSKISVAANAQIILILLTLSIFFLATGWLVYRLNI